MKSQSATTTTTTKGAMVRAEVIITHSRHT